MVDEPTNKDLLEYMAEMREEMATKADIVDMATKQDIERLGDRLQIVEHKIDKALFGEIDRHERWIRKIAGKVGVELKG